MGGIECRSLCQFCAGSANGTNTCWSATKSQLLFLTHHFLLYFQDKTADYLDICAALTGVVPRVGAHLESNRVPTLVLDARALVQQLEETMSDDLDAFFPTLGHLCGTQSDGRVPILIGLEEWKERVSLDHLKAFCAAFGTTGSSPLIHIAGITPEACDTARVQAWADQCIEQKLAVTITIRLLQETYSMLDKDVSSTKVDLVALGNPHLSVSECQTLAQLVQRASSTAPVIRKHPDTRVIACMSRSLQKQAEEAGHIQPLQEFGVEFVNDTCWCMLLDPPVIPVGDKATILTNSGKYAHYGPGLTRRRFRFGSMADCVQTATTGRYTGSPAWIASSRSYHTRTRLRLGSIHQRGVWLFSLRQMIRKLR